MRFRSVIAVTLYFALIEPVNSVEDLSPEVFQVQSGGACSFQEKQGNIRVIVKNQGFEHIVSTVYVDCIGYSNPDRGPEVLFRSTLENSGYFSVQIERLEFDKSNTTVKLTGVASHSGLSTNCHYSISSEGDVEVIQSCAEGTNFDGT